MELPYPTRNRLETGSSFARELSLSIEAALHHDPLPELEAALHVLVGDAHVAFASDESFKGFVTTFPSGYRGIPGPIGKRRKSESTLFGKPPRSPNLPLTVYPFTKLEMTLDVTRRDTWVTFAGHKEFQE